MIKRKHSEEKTTVTRNLNLFYYSDVLKNDQIKARRPNDTGDGIANDTRINKNIFTTLMTINKKYKSKVFG